MDHLLQWITNFDYRLRDTAARARQHLQVMPVSEVGFYSSSLFELFESFPSLPLFFFRALLRAPALSPELSSSGQSHGVCRRATAGTGLGKGFPASFSSLLHALQIATCLNSSNIRRRACLPRCTSSAASTSPSTRASASSPRRPSRIFLHKSKTLIFSQEEEQHHVPD